MEKYVGEGARQMCLLPYDPRLEDATLGSIIAKPCWARNGLTKAPSPSEQQARGRLIR